MKAHHALSIALLGSAACVPTTMQHRDAFSSRFTDNNAAQIAMIFSHLPAAADDNRSSNALGVPLVAGVTHTGNATAVVLYDLAANRRLWSAAVNASSSPSILGDVVAVGAGTEVDGLDIHNGSIRWRVPMNGLNFMGAARDGGTAVVVMTTGANGNGTRVGRAIGIDAHSGDVKWSHQLIGILGRPAASGGFAFIPWDRQSIAVLNLETGVEQARVRSTDDTLSWVFASHQGVYYGSTGAYRWTPRSASGTRTGSAYMANPLTGVPGDPPLFRDAFTATTGTRTARDKIRFAFEPRLAERDAVAVGHDMLYLAYYRFIVAVNSRTGEVRWARALGPDDQAASSGPVEGTNAIEAIRRAQASFAQYDVESMTVTPAALVIVGGNGRVRALDPNTGAILGTQDLGAEIAAITTDLSGYHAPTAGSAPAPEGTARDQLVSLIRDTDNRLVPMRAYLVRQLGLRPEQEATRDLLELYRQRSIPSTLRQEIATALRARRNGAQFLVQALEGEESHYNFLENRQAPPLEVIAPTLAGMGAREAVPVLIQHMLDHETPLTALPAVISAISDLGDASAIPTLQAFVQRYKSDSAFAGDKDVPLQSAVAGIFRLGDATARQWLTNLSQDASAHEPLRTSITRLFQEERAGTEHNTEEQQLTHAREELQGQVNALRAAVDGYPREMTGETFHAEWSNHLDDLRTCAQSVLTRLPNLNQIRVTITLRSEPPDGLFQTTPPPARLSDHATFAQRMHAIEQQTHWVAAQLHALQAHQSAVRTVAYAPQDAEMRDCMNHVLQPLHFAGFGRSISTRTFQESISTVRAQANTRTQTGFGTPRGGNVLVPWFLVSSPSLDPVAGVLRAPLMAAVVAPQTATPTTTNNTTSPHGHNRNTPTASPAPHATAVPNWADETDQGPAAPEQPAPTPAPRSRQNQPQPQPQPQAQPQPQPEPQADAQPAPTPEPEASAAPAQPARGRNRPGRTAQPASPAPTNASPAPAQSAHPWWE